MNQNTKVNDGPQPEVIRQMFSEIADGYDLTNTVLSAGIHHLWRRALVRWSEASPGDRVLDCATGTGDLAIAFKRVVGPKGDVIGTDFCPEMMTTAPQKARKHNMDVRFEQADVLALPYPDRSFDVASIAFGIRNVQDPVQALKELGRVTRPGGRVMVLEFGQPIFPGVAQAFDFYSRHILPRIGGLITGKPQAYEYLQNSASEFPCREGFLKLIDQSGAYVAAEYRPVSLGIAYLYKAVVRG